MADLAGLALLPSDAFGDLDDYLEHVATTATNVTGGMWTFAWVPADQDMAEVQTEGTLIGVVRRHGMVVGQIEAQARHGRVTDPGIADLMRLLTDLAELLVDKAWGHPERLAIDAGVTADELQEALDRDQIEVAYQPIVDMRTREVVAAEALARWTRRDGSVIRPDAFIAVAERSGLVADITRVVLANIAGHMRNWSIPDGFRIALNASAAEFNEVEGIDRLLADIRAEDLSPQDLTIEITESVVMDDPDTLVSRLSRMRDAGLQVAIDDFGRAYSSLDRLARMPVDRLKIDRTFINGIGMSPTGTALVASIMRIASALDIEAIAEGVERADQIAHLAGWGCRLGQGWAFSRALPGEMLQPGQPLVA